MSRLVNALKWSAIERILTQALQLMVMVILARILGPKSYGLVGMLSIFISLSQVLIDSGFSSALIRKKKITEADYSTVFVFNIMVSIIIYFIIFLVSDNISLFFNEDILSPLIKVLGLTIIINALSIIHKAKLTIDMNFRLQSFITFISVIVSGTISILLAIYGLGVWSIVANSVLFSLLSAVLYNIYKPWFPVSEFSVSKFKEMFSFSKHLVAAGLLNVLFDNIYNVVIGKLYSPTQLGFFSQAKTLTSIPTNTFSAIIQRVTYRYMSELEFDNKKELTERFYSILQGVIFIFTPLITTLSFFSSNIINTLFGAEWLKAAPLLSIISYCYLFYPIHAINLNLLNVKGRSDLFLKLEIEKKIIISLLLFFTFSFGLEMICIGMVVYSFISTYLNSRFTSSYVDVSFLKQVLLISLSLSVSLLSSWISIILYNKFLVFGMPDVVWVFFALLSILIYSAIVFLIKYFFSVDVGFNK